MWYYHSCHLYSPIQAYKWLFNKVCSLKLENLCNENSVGIYFLNTITCGVSLNMLLSILLRQLVVMVPSDTELHILSVFRRKYHLCGFPLSEQKQVYLFYFWVVLYCRFQRDPHFLLHRGMISTVYIYQFLFSAQLRCTQCNTLQNIC